MGDARSAFDDDLKIDAFCASLCSFDCSDQRVNGVDVCRTAHFWNHDLVKAFRRQFQQVHDIAVPKRGVEAVDPHRQGFVAPINCVDGFNHIGACHVFVSGGDAVFEIKIDDVCGRRCHFGKQLGVRTRAEKLAAVWACRWGGLQAEAHFVAFRVGNIVALGLP